MYTSGGKCGKVFQPNHGMLANLPLVENVPWAFFGPINGIQAMARRRLPVIKRP